ncbi:HD-GYP domain-containing protein [Petroclostridium sp. X23]|uniref:HD-GYP domain-containing protein n=1 Tax=Petroclostridium sp. X23 TaxID=3045146 RepID=UPI0024AD3F31|nr:HD-GYP domain-containing protein [Petroclostridium sp. X23]WHH61000.1 HD-GYP domain-containing protein [Petroclostridium sp. X23]
MRIVPVNCVRENCTLGKTLYNGEGNVLLKQGTALNNGLLKRIADSGINTIYINDEYSDNEIEDIIKPEIKRKAVKTIKDTFESCRKISTNSSMAGNGKKQVIEARNMVASAVSDVSKSIVEEVLGNKSTLISLVDIKCMDSYTYEHCVSVATLSLILGAELGLNYKQLNELCIGALLHDIGNAFIPKEILNKSGKLTDAEYDIIKSHPTRGYEYVKESRELPAAAKVIILQHHERVDKSGYPKAIEGLEIHSSAKIVAITDMYDALTSDRPYRKAVPPNEVLELLMGSAGRHFDFQMVQAFVRKVSPYPVGTLVRLSNGEFGVVEEINPNYPLRPKVKIIKQNAVNIEIQNIDLLTEKNIVIEGIQYEAPNLSVPHYLKKD